MAKKKSRLIYAGVFSLTAFILIVVFLSPSSSYDLTAGRNALDWFLARVFPETTSPEELREKYKTDKLKILLVPGHELKYSGAVYGSLTEAQLNLEVARYLNELLITDDKFEVLSVRDLSSGEYNPIFFRYFKDNRGEITNFRNSRKKLVDSLVASGEFERKITVNHNFALEEVALKLYGINKWSNENDVDLSLHIHFNDYPGRRGSAGYSGFSIYVPEEQYPNARVSQAIGQSIRAQLSEFSSTSNHPLEASGVIESQELIALGSQASQDRASVLIEYGYIYESQFRNPDVRRAVIQELAFKTYLGIKSYLENRKISGSSILPYRFSRGLKRGNRGRGVLGLQTLLKREGLYPPSNRPSNSCPINGRFGPCTEESVKSLQARYRAEILHPLGLKKPTGVVGPSTISLLNTL